MEPYIITIARKGLPNVTYNIYAKDRDDAIAFAKRVHRLDFKRVVSCRRDKDAQKSFSHVAS